MELTNVNNNYFTGFDSPEINREFSPLKLLEFFEKNDLLEVPPNGRFLVYGLDESYTQCLQDLFGSSDPEDKKIGYKILCEQMNEWLLPIGKRVKDIVCGEGKGDLKASIDPSQRAVALRSAQSIKIFCHKADLATSVGNLMARMLNTNRSTLMLQPNQRIWIAIPKDELDKILSANPSDHSSLIANFFSKEALKPHIFSMHAIGDLDMYPVEKLMPLNQPALSFQGSKGIEISIKEDTRDREFSLVELVAFFEKNDLLEIPRNVQLMICDLDPEYVKELGDALKSSEPMNSFKAINRQIDAILLPIGKVLKKISSKGKINIHIDTAARAVALISPEPMQILCAKGDLITSVSNLITAMIKFNRQKFELTADQSIFFTISSKELQDIESKSNKSDKIEAVRKTLEKMLGSHSLSIETEGNLNIVTTKLVPSGEDALDLQGTIGISLILS